LRTLEAEWDLTQARPVIARPDWTVIAGNMRVEGARELGRKTISTVFADLDEVQAAIWMFLDNRSFGEDDDDLAAELLAELATRGADLDTTGFSRPQTDALLRRLLHRHQDPDQLPAIPVGEPSSELGEVYQLGTHRVMCGDATNEEHVAVLLGGAEPTVIATDPPYGIELDNGWRDRAGLNRRRGGGRQPRIAGHETTNIASDSRADWSDAFALVPSCTVAYVWHASAHACEVQAGLERVGFDVKQQIIWDKGLFALSRQDYHWRHEPAWYATRRGAKVPWLGPRNQSTVWEAASPKMVIGLRHWSRRFEGGSPDPKAGPVVLAPDREPPPIGGGGVRPVRGQRHRLDRSGVDRAGLLCDGTRPALLRPGAGSL